MKITYTQMLLAILFSFMVLYLFSCVPLSDTPCPDPPETVTVNLPDNLKKSIPYTGYDTLMFIRSTDGDTHTFVGQGVKKGHDLMQRNGGDEECPSSKGKALMEFVIYTFVSPTYSSPITFEMYYNEYPVSTWLKIRFNNKTYERPTTVFGSTVKDSFLVAGRVHYYVSTIADSYNPSSQTYYTLFNPTYGILKFRFETGEEWELLSQP